ncbi:VanW family protein [Paenibacillus silvisoli]|uniref:VanW family protein n=1 Tax=Paenibacillus silvisoli TaxID=3110539 RepID=UPI0028062B9F|nr:VanW family protein [Paenibacillus silvisoli]
MKLKKALSAVAVCTCLSLSFSSLGMADKVGNGGADYNTASPAVKKQMEENSKRLQAVDAFQLSEFKRTQDVISGLLAQGADISAQEDYLRDLLELSASFQGKLIAQTAIAFVDHSLVLANWTERLNGIELAPGQALSLLRAMKESKLEPVKGESLDALATGIYTVALDGGLEIMERSTGRTLPAYAALGYEAKVVPGETDLVLRNAAKEPVKLYMEYYDGVLYMYAASHDLSDTYRIIKKDQETISPRTIVQADPARTVQGSPGAFVRIYRETLNAEREVVKTEWISEDYYAPVHRITAGGPEVVSDVTN